MRRIKRILDLAVRGQKGPCFGGRWTAIDSNIIKTVAAPLCSLTPIPTSQPIPYTAGGEKLRNERPVYGPRLRILCNTYLRIQFLILISRTLSQCPALTPLSHPTLLLIPSCLPWLFVFTVLTQPFFDSGLSINVTFSESHMV